jgi:hypothetical protein
MADIGKISREYEAAVRKKKEFSEKLRELEKTDPNKFYEIWIIRDQIAYWEGKSEGLKFALDAINQ